MKTIIQIIALVFISQSVIAQQNVNYNNKTFIESETIEAKINRDGFSVYIAEHELRIGENGKYELANKNTAALHVYDKKMPKSLSLTIEVTFKNGFKFPIEPKDSVFISLSSEKHGYNYSKKFSKVYASKESELKTATQNSKSINATFAEKSKALTNQYRAGKISLEEFTEKMTALSNPMIQEIERTEAENTFAFPEEKEATTYSIFYVDGYDLETSLAFNGTLHIERFNKKEFVATFRGDHMVDCLERRAASSREEEKKCKAKKSSLIESKYVLREEAVKGNINVQLKTFEDYR